MTDLPDDDALSREFDMLAARAGLVIPEGRRPGLLAGFKDMRRMLVLLRQPRTAANEPASTFSIDTVTRSLNS
jgi:hypothetical protein